LSAGGVGSELPLHQVELDVKDLSSQATGIDVISSYHHPPSQPHHHGCGTTASLRLWSFEARVPTPAMSTSSSPE